VLGCRPKRQQTDKIDCAERMTRRVKYLQSTTEAPSGRLGESIYEAQEQRRAEGLGESIYGTQEQRRADDLESRSRSIKSSAERQIESVSGAVDKEAEQCSKTEHNGSSGSLELCSCWAADPSGSI